MATLNGGSAFFRYPNYEKETKYCSEFLNNFEDHNMPQDMIHGRKKYLVQLQEVMNGKRVLIEIECEDLEDYFSKQEFSGFLESIKTNTKRYQKLFTDAADEIQLIRTDAQAEVESFDEVLDNFRLSNLERKDGAKPPKEFLNALKRKL